MQQLKNRTLLLKLLLIFFITTSISAVHFVIDSPHIVTIKITQPHHSSNLMGLTQHHFLTSIEYPTYFKKIILKTDTAFFQNIFISIDTKEFFIKKEDLIPLNANIFKNKENNASYYEVRNLLIYKSNLPFLNQFINCKKDASLLQNLLLNPFQFLIASMLIIVLFIKRYSSLFKTSTKHTALQYSNKHLNLIAVLLFIFLFFVLLTIHPFYFLKEDMYAQFQPIIEFSFNSFYETGQLPTYNPYQFAGMPTMPQSNYSLFYPVAHLSWWISKFIILNSHHFNTVYAFIHLGIGYWFLIKSFKKIGLPSILILVFSVSFIFSGVVLFWASNWYYILPTIAFLPILFYVEMNFVKKQSTYFMVLLLIWVVYFYSGNVQFFTYSFCFWLGYKWMVQFSLKKCLQLAVFSFVLILFCLPQLLISFAYFQNIQRPHFSGGSTFSEFVYFLNPLKAYYESFKIQDPFIKEYHLSFYNNLFYAVFLSLIVTLSIFLFYQKPVNKQFKFLLVAFLISAFFFLGKSGGIWLLLNKLPIFEYFHHPVKLAIYLIFFSTLITSFLSKKIIRTKWARIYFKGMITVSILTITLTFWQNQKMFNRHSFKIAYEKPAWLNQINTGNQYRIWAMAASTYTNESKTLLHNFATAYKVPAFNGWDELNDAYPNTQLAPAFGVKYYIISQLKDYESGPTHQSNVIVKDSLQNKYITLYHDQETTIYEDTSCQPIFQFYQNSYLTQPEFNLKYHNQGFDLKFKKEQNHLSKIVLAFMYRKGIIVKLNGVEQKISPDKMNRIVLKPDRSFQHLQLYYNPFELIGF